MRRGAHQEPDLRRRWGGGGWARTGHGHPALREPGMRALRMLLVPAYILIPWSMQNTYKIPTRTYKLRMLNYPDRAPRLVNPCLRSQLAFQHIRITCRTSITLKLLQGIHQVLQQRTHQASISCLYVMATHGENCALRLFRPHGRCRCRASDRAGNCKDSSSTQ